MIKLLEHRTPMKEVVLTEGPGAGYDVRAQGYHFTDGRIISVTPSKTKTDGLIKLYVKCDIQGTCDDISASSYYYGTGEDSIKNVPIKCVEFMLEEYLEDLDKNWHVCDSTNIKSLDTIEWDFDNLLEMFCDVTQGAGNSEYFSYGGGWSHATYDGTLDEINEGDSTHMGFWLENTQYYIDVLASIMIDNSIEYGQRVIEFIDEATAGENYYQDYCIINEDGTIEDGFETEEEAIKYAKEYGYPQVDVVTEFYDINGEPIDWGAERETIWEAEEE